MKTALISIVKHVYAMLACLYLFLIGFLIPKHRFLIQKTIFKHFDFRRIRKNKRKSIKIQKIEIQDSELKEILENYQFGRYAMYIDIMAFIQEVFHKENLENPKIVEFGGSNGIIKKMFHNPNYEVAENYPRVDIHDLSNFAANYYDFIILDQVLEHVRDPKKCVQEIYRILKKDGWLIITTPFLVYFHPFPEDFWRFTKQGMEELLSNFSKIIVKSWGNKEIAINHIETCAFPSTKIAKQQGWFNLENEEEYPHVVWGYSRK